MKHSKESNSTKSKLLAGGQPNWHWDRKLWMAHVNHLRDPETIPRCRTSKMTCFQTLWRNVHIGTVALSWLKPNQFLRRSHGIANWAWRSFSLHEGEKTIGTVLLVIQSLPNTTHPMCSVGNTFLTRNYLTIPPESFVSWPTKDSANLP